MGNVTVTRPGVHVPVSTAEVKRLRALRARLLRRLAQNHERLIVPWSYGQIARLRGINKGTVTLVLQGKRRAPDLLAYLDALAAGKNGRAAR